MPQVLDSIDTYLQELNLVTILFRLAPQNKDWNDDLCVLEDAQVPFLEMG